MTAMDDHRVMLFERPVELPRLQCLWKGPDSKFPLINLPPGGLQSTDSSLLSCSTCIMIFMQHKTTIDREHFSKVAIIILM